MKLQNKNVKLIKLITYNLFTGKNLTITLTS